jgi:hypothetical protein
VDPVVGSSFTLCLSFHLHFVSKLLSNFVRRPSFQSRKVQGETKQHAAMGASCLPS